LALPMEAELEDTHLARPRWLRDLRRFLPLKSQFLLTGNVRDLQVQVSGGQVSVAPLQTVIANELAQAGFVHLLNYDPVWGFRQFGASGEVVTENGAVAGLGLTFVNGAAAAGPDLLAATIERCAAWDGPPLALIVDFASRLVVRSDALSAAEHNLFVRAHVTAHAMRARPVGAGRAPLYTSIIWVADKEGDLPDWMTIGNPRLRHVPISKPDRSVRRAIAPALVRSLPGANDARPEARATAEHVLVDQTEGLLLSDINAICQLARSESVAISDLGEAVLRYKLGVTEDAWRRIERAKVAQGAEQIGRRVVGQQHAVTHMLDIVKRAVTGVSGARRGGRPRGVAFLAGPTGVGKTELAKAVTELLFGDESAYIRFDMSEFSAEHADQRLIGAPPGYVGYDMGGELTNAIREKPFSVVLFDEIEKAHPRILDKFLQVLDDGVLTSGRGDRVYFSESLIVFTSNLGIYGVGADGERVANVAQDEDFAALQSKVRAEIERHFKLTLGRPEILNRIGDNIIVFDFIRPDVAQRIFEQMTQRALQGALDAGYQITLSDEARKELKRLCIADLSNGGRGIRNKLETHLINPLARALFELPPGAYVINAVVPDAVTRLELGVP
jgi:energy-coupling factor transporter ATP-binding protein EcfA2